MTPKIIYIEGNIGTGKSTFLKNLDKSELKQRYKYEVIYEPVDEWQQEGILEKFYSDPVKYCYLFQSYCLFSRFRLLKRIDKRDDLDFVFIERSIFSDKYVFADGCKKLDQLEDIEYKLYNNWFNHFRGIHTIYHYHIYLRLDPEICLQRVNKRNRDEESGLSLDYLRLLHNQHEKWSKDNDKFIKICDNRKMIDAEDFLKDVNDYFRS